MILAMPAPHIRSHQTSTMLFAYHKMLDAVQTERDRQYAEAFLRICTLPFEDKNWLEVYTGVQPTMKTIMLRQRTRAGKCQMGINPDILDLTVIVLDLIESQPSDPYWPQRKMIQALRSSVCDVGLYKRFIGELGVCRRVRADRSRKRVRVS